MGISRTWCIILVVIAACTCGARTECGETVQILFLLNGYDEPSCAKLLKDVMLYENAKFLAEIQNNKTDEFNIEITVFDTCKIITSATVKASDWVDIMCLHPPHYLGTIGYDPMINVKTEIYRMTSTLEVPHIVKKPSIFPYLHSLTKESNSYSIQGILKMIEILKWKSFTLVTNIDDDIQNIAKKLTINAKANNLCVIIHNNEEDYTSHIVYIGKPEEKFFNKPKNATILIISEGNLKDYLSHINSTNSILLLEESRNIINDLEWKVENSQLWAPGFRKYQRNETKELKQVRWLENVMEIYVKALKELCKNEKCKKKINPLDWDHTVSNIMTHNVESKSFNLFMKKKTNDLESLGSIIVRQNRTQIYWDESKAEKEEDVTKKIEKNYRAPENNDNVPYMFRELLKGENKLQSECVTTIKEIKMLNEKENEATQILVSGMDDNEWWIMVYTVSGVGIAMFLVGILAVYIIYINIQGPRCAKNKNHLDRDISLRRMSNDRELPTTITTRNQQALRTLQRKGSDSTISEKSV